jgi:hypothetical protein
MPVEKNGEKFSGYNKPKRTPKHPKKSHAVLAKEGEKVKLIRFGQQGVSGAGKLGLARVLRLPLRRLGENRSRPVMLRTSRKARCLQLTGRTR